MSDCKVIASSIEKGGLGKTTTVVDLGVALAMRNKKVLLVDCDPQGHLTLALGWGGKENLHPTIAKHLEARAKAIHPWVISTCFVTKRALKWC